MEGMTIRSVVQNNTGERFINRNDLVTYLSLHVIDEEKEVISFIKRLTEKLMNLGR